MLKRSSLIRSWQVQANATANLLDVRFEVGFGCEHMWHYVQGLPPPHCIHLQTFADAFNHAYEILF